MARTLKESGKDVTNWGGFVAQTSQSGSVGLALANRGDGFI
jgi:hypothetical protein